MSLKSELNAVETKLEKTLNGLQATFQKFEEGQDKERIALAEKLQKEEITARNKAVTDADAIIDKWDKKFAAADKKAATTKKK